MVQINSTKSICQNTLCSVLSITSLYVLLYFFHPRYFLEVVRYPPHFIHKLPAIQFHYLCSILILIHVLSPPNKSMSGTSNSNAHRKLSLFPDLTFTSKSGLNFKAVPIENLLPDSSETSMSNPANYYFFLPKLIATYVLFFKIFGFIPSPLFMQYLSSKHFVLSYAFFRMFLYLLYLFSYIILFSICQLFFEIFFMFNIY